MLLLARLRRSPPFPLLACSLSSPPRQEEEEQLSNSIARAVLAHRNSSPSALLSSLPSSSFPPSLVNRALRLLRFDPHCSLLLLRALLLLPSFLPHPSSLLRLPPRLSVRLLLSLPNPTTRHLNAVLHALALSGHLPLASSLLRSPRLPLPAPDAASFHALALAWCRRRLPSRAAAVLASMVRSGIPPTAASYNILLHGYFLARRPDLAVAFFRQIRKRGAAAPPVPDVVSYTTMIHGLGLAGRVRDAWKLFGEMRERKLTPTVATYNALIQVLCRKDRAECAMDVLVEMVQKGLAPNSITYNSIIRGICRGCNVEEGVEFMRRRMLDGGWRPNLHTYNMLIRCLMEVGEIEKGLELFEEMRGVRGCFPDQDTYTVLINAMFVRKRGEDMVKAGKLVTEMVERGHIPSSFMFSRILNGLFLTGNQEFARELLRVHSLNPRLRKKIRL